MYEGTAKYLFEFEKIFLYHQFSCTNRYRYHQYCQHSYPNIKANIFEATFLKRTASLRSLFLAI